jgi:hypothetical protein
MIFDMERAASGRRNDIVVFVKVLNKQIIAVSGKMLETRVRHGLPATGLPGWKFD